MRSTGLSFIFLMLAATAYCQRWTNEQLYEANTVDSVEYLTAQEKQVILYINLCRLYPKQFAAIELKNYTGIPFVKDKSLAKFKASLIRELGRRQPCDALVLDEDMYDNARCYSEELSKNKRSPHQRIDCDKGSYSECIFFGTNTGRYIAIEWLIDSGVASLGHRKICLNPNFAAIGISIAKHFQYGNCAVGEFGE